MTNEPLAFEGTVWDVPGLGVVLVPNSSAVQSTLKEFRRTNRKGQRLAVQASVAYSQEAMAAIAGQENDAS